MSRSKSSDTGTTKGQDVRGLAESSAEPRFLVIGQVVKPHGIRGEVRVSVYTDLPERFNWLEQVYIGANNPQPVQVEGVRFHKGLALLKLAGYDTSSPICASS